MNLYYYFFNKLDVFNTLCCLKMGKAAKTVYYQPTSYNYFCYNSMKTVWKNRIKSKQTLFRVINGSEDKEKS